MAAEHRPQPVTVNPIVLDGRPIDPGGAIARIVGLKAGGDGFVSVREGPTVRAAEIDRLGPGTFVIATHPADSQADAFIGIIYDHVGDTGAGPSLAERCQFSETIPATKPDRRAYLGPCRTGWVARRFVEILAD
ncbi:hypothetical protein [Xanthobacter agilis]|uniref:Uncharacterized protein n=1 Tax=Xanthobacter agilis TaxID=47492 RepID=A0ABU0LD64_XANAG|nr:hypothetical protein [Xanthobacter agilis]MDQ0505092.1 hypothetical protein [Xanthobacter agilis]